MSFPNQLMSNKSKRNRNRRRAPWSNCVWNCFSRFVFCSALNLKNACCFSFNRPWSIVKLNSERKNWKSSFFRLDWYHCWVALKKKKWNCSHSNRHCVSIIYPSIQLSADGCARAVRRTLILVQTDWCKIENELIAKKRKKKNQ